MAVCAIEGRYLFFMRYLPGGGQLFGKIKKMGRAVFQGRAWMITGQLIFYMHGLV